MELTFRFFTVADPEISEWGLCPVAVEFMGSGYCFDAPSHTTYICFCSESREKHNCTYCMLMTINVTNNGVKIYKNQKIFFNRVLRTKCARPGSAVVVIQTF